MTDILFIPQMFHSLLKYEKIFPYRYGNVYLCNWVFSKLLYYTLKNRNFLDCLLHKLFLPQQADNRKAFFRIVRIRSNTCPHLIDQSKELISCRENVDLSHCLEETPEWQEEKRIREYLEEKEKKHYWTIIKNRHLYRKRQ